MRFTFYLIFLIFVFWSVTMFRFQCTNIDRDACTAICEKMGKSFRLVRPGIKKECVCVTDWLKKAREEEELRKQWKKRLRENRRP